MRTVWLWIPGITPAFSKITTEDTEPLPASINVRVRITAQSAADSGRSVEGLEAKQLSTAVFWPSLAWDVTLQELEHERVVHYELVSRPPAGWRWLAFNGRLLAEVIR